MPRFLSTREVAEQISESGFVVGTVCEWQVRRLFELGDLPDPPRFGGKRMIDPLFVSQIVEAMKRRGWLKEPEPVSA